MAALLLFSQTAFKPEKKVFTQLFWENKCGLDSTVETCVEKYFFLYFTKLLNSRIPETIGLKSMSPKPSNMERLKGISYHMD